MDSFFVLRRLPGEGRRLVGYGTQHPYQIFGYSGPGLPLAPAQTS